MKIKHLRVDEIVETISETHDFNIDKLYAVNTSDILEGSLLQPPLMNTDDLKGQFKKTIKNGDILFSEIRPANKRYALVKLNDTSKYVVSTKLMVLRKFNDDVDLNYFYYWLTNEKTLAILQFRAENRICSFPQITFDLLSEYEVPIPDIVIQKKVSKILSCLDNKIKNNKTVINELEKMAKTIYDYWFIQYEFPNEDGKTYKSSGGKMVWNEEVKKEIPEGWKVKKVGDILSKIPNTYKYTSAEYKEDGKFPIIDQSSNYICGYTDKEEDLLKLNDCVVFGDHTKFVKYVNFDFARGADGTQILNSSDDRLPNYLLYMQISNMQLVSQGYSRYFKFLKDKYVIIPEKEISDMYISKVKKTLEKIKKCREENKELSKLRDYLLPLLMNGQVGF